MAKNILWWENWKIYFLKKDLLKILLEKEQKMVYELISKNYIDYKNKPTLLIEGKKTFISASLHPNKIIKLIN